jgi:CHAT domain/Protein of unknown function (DUF3039)
MNGVAELLRLEVRAFEDQTRWRWVLIDEADGAEVAVNDVQLDVTDWQFKAFADLYRYLGWHVAPDRRGIDDIRIVGEVGEWIGTQVFGLVADALAGRARHHHVTVRVVAPADAADLLLRPLELAHVNGRPLAAQGITLVMQPKADSAAGETPAPRDRLRVLGLFSLPEGGQPLNLRRERQALVALIRGISKSGKGAEVRVLQYGVTRVLLWEVLAEAEGWDIIHISGHGAPGELLLETADGKPDRVTAAELADLLMAAREHVRLITVSACSSAADFVADQRRRLDPPVAGLPAAVHGTRPSDAQRPHLLAALSAPPGTLATELADRLDCAVLAMRYPVDDEFAIALSSTLYGLLAMEGRPLPQAVGLTLRQLSGERAFAGLCLVTPTLFGGTAVGLSLAAPDHDGPADDNLDGLEMSGFPPEPERFVGRVSVMARCSAALALRSGVPGVLLHGMPGGGKTACALELAYGHEHAFDHLVWYKAPDEGMMIDGALTDFAFTLKQYLPGFQMLDALVSDATLTGFLPRLAELARQRRILIVIDNAESLIAEGGEWRDARWGQVIGALTAHAELGRVILTSRRVPTGLTGLRAEAVDALSADETLLLMRELPHLSALMHGKVPGIAGWTARRLARRALEAAQGHPKLLELADGQATHPDQLAKLVEEGNRAWQEQGGLPTGFWATRAATTSADGTALTTADYWHVLTAWTTSVADMLTQGERDMFWFLCCLEESDRTRHVVEEIWPELWNDLGRDGQPPDFGEALAALTAHGLASALGDADDDIVDYLIHPGVAEAGRGHAGQSFRDAVDAEAADLWNAYFGKVLEEADTNPAIALALRVERSLLAYLLRRQRWELAAALLHDMLLRDPSRSNALLLLPATEHIARHDPSFTNPLAKMLAASDADTADDYLRAYMAEAQGYHDHKAMVVAGSLRIDRGKNEELAPALDLAEAMIDFIRQAALGPWFQLLGEVQRLEVLNAMGQARQVLDEVTRLRADAAVLRVPPDLAPGDAIAAPWRIRERLLAAGREASEELGLYDDALALNAELSASMFDRLASASSIVHTRFSDYGPLKSLGRTEEALQVLLFCQRASLITHDTGMLGTTLGALADIEHERGHGDAAIQLQHDGLRYLFRAGGVENIAASYHNLGTYLRADPRQPVPALASHLAAALIGALTGLGSTDASLHEVAADLREFGADAVPPVDVADLCHQVGDIHGTDLPMLIQNLSPDSETTEAALRNLISRATAITAQPSSAQAARKQGWWRRAKTTGTLTRGLLPAAGSRRRLQRPVVARPEDRGVRQDHGGFAHYPRHDVEPGEQATALCGWTWIPQRFGDISDLPACPQCLAYNDALPAT